MQHYVLKADLDLTVCGISAVIPKITQASADGRPFDVVISVQTPREDERAGKSSLPDLPAYADGRHFVLSCPDNAHLTPPEKVHLRQDITHCFRFLAKAAAACPEGATLKVLIHCYHGISRSAALALVAKAATPTGQGAEEIVEWLSNKVPDAAPHLDIVDFGSHLIGLKPTLRDAVERHHKLRPRLQAQGWLLSDNRMG